jgi:beta-barrel assembly-enhancing protease
MNKLGIALVMVIAPWALTGCMQTVSSMNPNQVASLVQTTVKTASAVSEATKEFTPEEEVAIGESVVAGMLGVAPLVPNAALQRYVNQVGRWVAVQSEKPQIPWRFGVIDNPNINAFAAPGGQILITAGLMNRLNSEAELAGVLGHEIAHVLEGHQVKAMRSGALGDAGKIAAVGIFQASKAGQTVGGQLATATGIVDAGANLVKDGFFIRPLDRSMEYDADRIGVILMARAGYDPYAYLNVLQTLQSLKAGNESLFALLGKTHPDPADRISNLENVLTSIEGQAPRDLGRERYLAMVGRGSEVAASRSSDGRSPARAPAKAPAKAPTKAPAKAAPKS